MRAIFLLTVQHTGTWWTINTLRTHPDIKGFAHIRNVLNLHLGMPLTGIDAGIPSTESLSQDGINLLHTHWFRVYEKGRWQWDTMSDALVVLVPTIMPLRDPLLSLLTRHNRDSWMYPHTDLLDEWIRLAGCGLPIEYFKMDLYAESEFLQALHNVGLAVPRDWVQFIDRTTVDNTSGNYVLKEAYYDGNKRYIQSAVPDMWSRLTAAESYLRPFLERHGYSNLLWW